jgi:hypothetical protein
MTTYKQQLHAIAERVAADYAARPGVEAILLTGSVARGRVDAVSDVDMTIYYADLPSAEEFEAIKQAALASGGGIYSYDAERWLACYQFVDGVKVDTGHQRSADLSQMVSDFRAEPKVDDPNLHIVLSGVLRGIALHGAAHIQAWQQALADCPPGFDRTLVTNFLRFAPVAVMREMGADRDDYPLVYELMLEATRNILNVLCGLNRIIPPGKLKGMEATLERLTIAPRDVVVRMRRIWVLPPAEGVRELYALIDELIGLVEIHMPDVDTAPVRERIGLPLRRA